MMIQSLFSLRFAIAISFSFAASSYSTTKEAYSPNFLPVKSYSTPATPPAHKATASDLLSILVTLQQASTVNPTVAKELRSGLKFLVPFSPNQLRSESETPLLRRELNSKSESRSQWSEQDKLVWWPPTPVMELARLSVDSGGDPEAISRALDSTMIPKELKQHNKPGDLWISI